MPKVATKRIASPRRSRADVTPGVLQKFHCEMVSYAFRFPIEAFDLKKFTRRTNIKTGERWSAILSAKNPVMDCHAHFDGRITSKLVFATVAYWEGAAKRDEDEPEPFAESIMQWLGSFVREPSYRATAPARFKKPVENWRGRFNLPFKVTMAGSEVTIDGVSLLLPSNSFRVRRGWLTKTDKEVIASVESIQSVEFDKFEIGLDVDMFNDAIKMFVEPLP